MLKIQHLTLLLHIYFIFFYHSHLFLGVVSKPTSQVASSGEAGGERHQAAGHSFPLSSFFWPIHHQLPGLRAAAGALALHPYHIFGPSAVAAGLHQRLTDPTRGLRSLSSPIHASFLASVNIQLPSPGTQSSPFPHQFYVLPATHIPVLSQPQELQYSLTEDESQGAHSVYWEDVVMPNEGLRWTCTSRRRWFEKILIFCRSDCKILDTRTSQCQGKKRSKSW